MSSGVIVSSIFFARHQLLRMEQLAIGSSSHFVDDGGLQIHKNGPGNMFTSSSLSEKCAERVISCKGKKGKKISNLARGNIRSGTGCFFTQMHISQSEFNLFRNILV